MAPPSMSLDGVSDEDRIALARAIAKTNLADRETRLKELLAERGGTVPQTPAEPH